LEQRAEPLLPAPALPAYQRLIDVGFGGVGGVGGSLYGSLRGRYPQRRLDAAFRATRLDAGTPVGLVWPGQWLALFRLLHLRA
jgi:23S rRNA (adenine-N6)-dimethyltransferase